MSESAKSSIDFNALTAIGVWVLIILGGMFFLVWPNITKSNSEASGGATCTDVTSYDRNWDNDMYCTRPNGSTFYTDYAGARRASAQ